MRILIIGASGFIGSHILKALTMSDHEIVIATRNKSNLRLMAGYKKLFLHKNNFKEGLIKYNENEKIDLVIHAAGVINIKKGESKFINTDLTHIIIEGLRSLKNSPRLIYISSVSAINLLGIYGIDKRKSEELIIEGYDNWTILRPSLVYGLGDKKNIGTLINFIKLFPFIPVFKENICLQPLHINDLISTILKLTSGIGKNKFYTLAGPNPEKYSEIVKKIIKATKSRTVIIPISLKTFQLLVNIASKIIFFYRFPVQQISGLSNHPPWDISLAQKELGFNPRKFDVGIAGVITEKEQLR